MIGDDPQALEAWRQRIEQRRTDNARRRQLDHDALVASLRPRQRPPGRGGPPRRPRTPTAPPRPSGRRSWPLGRPPAEQLAAEYAAGASLAELGRTYRVHLETVRRALLAAGVTMRPARRTKDGEAPRG